MLQDKPQLYAKRAAPACLRHAVRCSLLRSSSVLYPRTTFTLLFFLHHVFNTLLDLLCTPLALPTAIETSGHAGDNCYKVINQLITCISGKDHFKMSSLSL